MIEFPNEGVVVFSPPEGNVDGFGVDCKGAVVWPKGVLVAVCPPDSPLWTGAVDDVFVLFPKLPPAPKVLAGVFVVSSLAGYFA